jgi:hypothetical protein
VIRLDNKVIIGRTGPNNIQQVPNDPISITQYRENIDCSNARIATFDRRVALLTWEEEEVEDCRILSGCKSRKYIGTSFLKLDEMGKPLEQAYKSIDVFVSGDIIQVWNHICWPYVNMVWNTSKGELAKYPKEHEPRSGGDFLTVKKLSFACITDMQ